MKFKLLSVIVFIAVILTACGDDTVKQNSSDSTLEKSAVKSKSEKEKAHFKNKTEEKIARIRADFQAIENSLSVCRTESKTYQNPDPAFYFDMANFMAYYKDNQIVKLVENVGEEGYASDYSYYLRGGELFFIYIERYYTDNKYQEERIYIDGGKIIKALDKSKEPGDEKTAFSSLENVSHPQFKKDASAFTLLMLETYRDAIEKFNKAEPSEW